MKVQERNLDVTSTLTGEKIGMTIDPGSLAKIMGVLTDLYSDPEAAVIREYSTNAWDAHIVSGVTRPIEITLPSPLAPFFRVKDYGAGMDVEDIRTIYSRYGTSTKSDSNDVVGMLGLGAKSALTYTNQFTLIGIKGGISTQVSISRDADGAGSMTVVSQEPTNEPSGVEVIVPVKVGNRFQQKANEFFRFWNPEDVLVNGVRPNKVDGMWITDDLLLSKSLNQSYVVMGNVAYPVNDYSLTGGRYFRVVAFVDIGEVAFTPSREALQMTTQTKNTLAKLKVRIEKEANAAMKKELDAAPDRHSAIIALSKVTSMGYTGDSEWRGIAIPEYVSYPKIKVDPKDTRPHGPFTQETILTISIGGYSGRNGYRYSTVSLRSNPDSFWITGYESELFSPYKRKKLNQWLDVNGFTATQFHFVKSDKIPNSEWINPKNIHPWADIDAQKLPKEAREKRSDGRPTGSYKGFVAGLHTTTLLAKDIDTTVPLFWMHGNVYGRAYTLTKKNFPNATFVALPANRVDKFKRDFPMARNCEDYCNELATAWNKKLTAEDILGLKIRHSSIHPFLNSLDEAKIADPEFKRIVQVAKIKGITKLMEEKKELDWFGATYDSTWDNPISKKYPLLFGHSYSSSVSGNRLDHVYLYANAVYAAEKKGA